MPMNPDTLEIQSYRVREELRASLREVGCTDPDAVIAHAEAAAVPENALWGSPRRAFVPQGCEQQGRLSPTVNGDQREAEDAQNEFPTFVEAIAFWAWPAGVVVGAFLLYWALA